MNSPVSPSPLDSATPADPLRLTTPAERPDAEIVIYDGNCSLCTNQANRLHRWDRRGQLAFLSQHDPMVRERFSDLSDEILAREMVVVDRQSVRHRGAAAVRHLCKRLPRLWLLVPLLYIPGSLPLWQWLYRLVADRRYWFGRRETCPDNACQLTHPHSKKPSK